MALPSFRAGQRRRVLRALAPLAAPALAGDGSRWVTLGRACEILGVDESTLRRWADSGRLRVYRTPGGHRRFSLGDLEALVSSESRSRGGDQVGRMATARIRRQLHRARLQEGSWYAGLSEADRLKLRDLGRHLIELVGEYLAKRTRRATLMEDARRLGENYGHLLSAAGLSLPAAVEAYIGFCKTLDDTIHQGSLWKSLSQEEALTACGQVHALADQVLLGIAASYATAVPAASRP